MMRRFFIAFVFLLIFSSTTSNVNAGFCNPDGVSCDYVGPDNWACQPGCCPEPECPSDPGGCFPQGTQVTLSNKSTKNIEDVQVGDVVLSQDENGLQSVSTVQKLLQPVSDNMCTIGYTNGDELKVTKGHPLATTLGWKAIDVGEALKEDPEVPVTRLNVGDFMIKNDGSKPQISSISCKDESIQTYNLIVDNDHTYFASEFLVHNKGGCWCASKGFWMDCGDQSWCCPGDTNFDPNVGQCVCPGGYVRIGDSCVLLNDICPPPGQWVPQWYIAVPCFGAEPKWCDGGLWADEPGGCVNCHAYTNYYCTCTAGAPSNLTFTKTSITSGVLSWTPGGNGVSQKIYIGDDSTKVASNCPSGTGAGTGCLTVATNLPMSQNSYNASGLTANKVYYFKILNYVSDACYSSITIPSMASCQISPSPIDLVIGDAQTVFQTAESNSGIVNVSFSGGAGFYSISQGNDATSPYSTDLMGTAITTPTTILTSNVYYTGVVNPICTDTASVTVIRPGPWWQVVDSDVYSRGELNSNIPYNQLFSMIGAGGFPGVASYSTTTDLVNPRISTTGWIANSPYSSTKVYNYNFFKNQIPNDTVINSITSGSVDASAFESGGTPSYGYYWYKFDGNTSGLDLTITGDMNLGSRKVVILVDGANLYLNGNTALTDGEGFLGVFVGKNTDGNKGNIYIDPTVTALEGIYTADGIVSTGETDQQLYVRGSVAGITGVSLGRDMDPNNGTTPAEVFEYAPDLIMLFPSKLSVRKINWKEVAP